MQAYKMTVLKEALKGKLPKKEIDLVPRSFDVVGSIAIFSEMPSELMKKEKMIGNELMKLNKNIKTVAKKVGFHKGKYRTKKLKIIAGENTKETICKENGVAVRLDVEKCYYSPRLSNERLRIAGMARPNESILVMFSGVGIYPLVIAKNSKAKEIYGIELNPAAHRYAVENLKINKIKNISLVKGDVKKEARKLGKKFDRIVMPLPKSAGDFLQYAFAAAKKNATIHFYDFEHENEENLAIEKIKKKIKKFKILNVVRCGQYSPNAYRICVDFKIL